MMLNEKHWFNDPIDRNQQYRQVGNVGSAYQEWTSIGSAAVMDSNNDQPRQQRLLHSYQVSLSSKSAAGPALYFSSLFGVPCPTYNCVEFPGIVNDFYDHVASVH
ncbi:predicted protein [Lichtheimia corymbifera JMRC:FSU:9682]|uniref:Uncharacterized protein n=1 Tax=Lichtheimia corymbifera JMRC:FSU:9682 TaxID=1263082 RepID=A0A068S6X4_9FUNG|nr:predicted protein [Lichtheimia corymbifera JMRC:FSU:9682]